VDDNQADLFAKDLYRHLRRNPWLWQTVDPEELACEVTDPEALHDLVKQIYEPMRHLLNALTKRLKESGKVKDTPQPLPVPGRKWTS
jgi:hypothetical protein